MYWRMCEVYGEKRSSKEKMFTDRLNMNLLQRSLVEKTRKTHRHSGEQKVPVAAVSKELDADIKGPITIDFFKKVLLMAHYMGKISDYLLNNTCMSVCVCERERERDKKKRCLLEHAENKSLNKRSKLIFKCKHVNKFLLCRWGGGVPVA